MTIVGILLALASLGVAVFCVMQVRLMGEAMALNASKATQALAQVKGLSAHHADPEAFAPNSIAREDMDKAEARQIDAVKVKAIAREKIELLDAIRGLEARGNFAKANECKVRLEKLELEA